MTACHFQCREKVSDSQCGGVSGGPRAVRKGAEEEKDGKQDAASKRAQELAALDDLTASLSITNEVEEKDSSEKDEEHGTELAASGSVSAGQGAGVGTGKNAKKKQKKRRKKKISRRSRKQFVAKLRRPRKSKRK